MALQKDIILDNGLIAKDAYIVISAIQWTRKSCILTVESYCNKEYFHENKSKISSKVFGFTPKIVDNSSNFIKQGYEYLKTLDQYKNAIDLLDEGQQV
ncbi:hypothetical protein [Clostridium septicum]|uniref:hypothetical protein n=1 Tax=Clostridium septicum TaxID=1504 RepID=UPI00082B29E4|nr:hypothetical protein [Clostridium septicum]